MRGSVLLRGGDVGLWAIRSPRHEIDAPSPRARMSTVVCRRQGGEADADGAALGIVANVRVVAATMSQLRLLEADTAAQFLATTRNARASARNGGVGSAGLAGSSEAEASDNVWVFARFDAGAESSGGP